MATETTSTVYPFDPTGRLASNKVVGEQQIITGANFRDYHFIVPNFAPFFLEGLVLTHRATDGTVRTLVEGIDFYATHEFIAASRACAKPIYGSISFLNTDLAGVITLGYQTVGGIWTLDDAKIAEILADRLNNPRITSWDVIVDMVVTFPVIDHEWDLTDMVGEAEVVAALNGIEDILRTTGQTGLQEHIDDVNNPHATNKEQVGLGNVPNWGQVTQLVAEAGTQTTGILSPLRVAQAIKAQVGNTVAAHLGNHGNPHETTAAQVGAYSIAEMDVLLAGKVGDLEVAYDTSRFDGRDAIGFKDWVLEGTAANTLRFNNLTIGEFMTDVLSRKIADSTLFDGHSYDEVIATLSGGVATNTERFDGKTFTEATAVILGGTSANSTLFAGRTFDQAKTEMLAGGIDNALRFDGRSFEEAKAEILTGKSSDSNMLDGRTFEQAKLEILTGKAADSDRLEGRTTDQLIEHLEQFFGGALEATQQAGFAAYASADVAKVSSWQLLGSQIGLEVSAPAGDMPTDIQWMVAGGEANAAQAAPCYLVRLSVKGATPTTVTPVLSAVNLNGVDATHEFGYTVVRNASNIITGVDVWLKAAAKREAVTVTQLARNVGNLADSTTAGVDIEPVGIVYHTPKKVAFEADVAAALDSLTNAFNDLKAQVEAA